MGAPESEGAQWCQDSAGALSIISTQLQVALDMCSQGWPAMAASSGTLPMSVKVMEHRIHVQVSCSLDSSIVLTTADQGSHVLTFGDNSLGQLGRGNHQRLACSADDWVVREASGKPLSARSIAAGLSHNMAVLASGQVLSQNLPPLPL